MVKILEIDKRFIRIECDSLKNLSKITKFLDETHIEFVIIGGHAISVYCPGKRFTKDIDIAASLKIVNPLIAQLKRLEFVVDPFGHGDKILKASKSSVPQNIELHASIGEVFDETTSNSYSCDKLIANKNYLEITPFFSECNKYKTKIPVINPNDAFILKAMTNRERDLIDCFFYLNSNHLDLNRIIIELDQVPPIKNYILGRFTATLSNFRGSIRYPNSLIRQLNIITDYSFSNQDLRNLLRAIRDFIAILRE